MKKTKKTPKLPRSLDEIMGIALRVIHEQAAAEGISPQEAAQKHIAAWSAMLNALCKGQQRGGVTNQYTFYPPLRPIGGWRSGPITSNSEEYKALRAVTAEVLYEISRRESAAYKATKDGAAKSALLRKRLTPETIVAEATKLRERDGRPPKQIILAAHLGTTDRHLRRVLNQSKPKSGPRTKSAKG